MSILQGISDVKDEAGVSIIGSPGGAIPFSGAVAKLAGALTATTSSTTVTPLDAEDYDVGGWHDNVTNNSRLTVPAGVTRVRLSGGVRSAGSATGQFILGFYKNGAAFDLGGQQESDTTGGDAVIATSPVLEVIEGDYFEMTYYVSSGRDLDVSGTYFGIEAVTQSIAGKVSVPTTRTTTSETLVLSDANSLVRCSNASANTLTVPPNASVAFDIGTVITVAQEGTGQTTIVAGGGVTLDSAGALLALTSQYSCVTLIKKTTDTWAVTGDLS